MTLHALAMSHGWYTSDDKSISNETAINNFALNRHTPYID